MADRSLSVFKENLDWLSKDKLTHEKIAEGTVYQFAEHIREEYGEVSPVQALSIWNKLAGDSRDLESFALLCRYIVQSPFEVTGEFPHGTAVYFRNPVADRAYDEFSRIHGDLGAAYAPDFKSVCEEVYYDRADACILPLESSDDGLLMSFRHMLLKYELKIVSAVRIQTDEEHYLVMALLTNGNIDADGDMCEFYLPSLMNSEFISVCRAVECLSASVVRVTSVPSKSVGIYDHHICLTAQNDNISALKFFLDAVNPANILLGQYKNYNTERNIP